MQSNEIDSTTKTYVRPSSDTRRRLERMRDLKPWEVVKATKPAFGDVRAPRQWRDSADDVLQKSLGFAPHPLDACLYVSTREAANKDGRFCCFEWNKQVTIVGSVLGLHVSDFIYAVVKMSRGSKATTSTAAWSIWPNVSGLARGTLEKELGSCFAALTWSKVWTMLKSQCNWQTMCAKSSLSRWARAGKPW